MSEFFKHEITQGIAAIRFNRPDKLNAINHEMWLEFKKLADGFAKNKDVRALFLFSITPKAFSTGADMDEFERKSGDKKWRAANHKAIRGAMDAIAFFPKPTVAGISGLCFGGGLALAAACDIRYAEIAAKFSFPPAKIGLVYPFPEVKRLVALIGPSRAAEMLLTARTIDAKAARGMGLVSKIFAFDEYEKQLNLLAGQFSVLPAESLSGMKKMLIEVSGGQQKDTKETEALFLDAYDSDHFKKAIKNLRIKSNRLKGIEPTEEPAIKVRPKKVGKAKATSAVKPKANPTKATPVPTPAPTSVAKAAPKPKAPKKAKAPAKAKAPTKAKAPVKSKPKPKAPVKKTTKAVPKKPAKKAASKAKKGKKS